MMMHVAVATIALSAGWSMADGPKEAVPTVVALADDDQTRGDWIGTYGGYAYVLCGMRSPESLYGGAAAWDAKQPPKALLSSAPAAEDRSVLMEPSGLKRTPASWVEKGEANPQGYLPDLYIKVSVPQGPFLLSLYFFEIDWPQYRAYRIRVLTDEAKPVPLLATRVDNFLKGKYKRFVVLGPAKLLLVIGRGRNPDAQISGIFLDPLGVPDTKLFDFAVSGSIFPPVSPPESRPDLVLAEKSAEDALTRLLATPEKVALQEDYVRQEEAFLKAVEASAQSDPEAYYRKLESLWGGVEERTKNALSVLHGDTAALAVRLLSYYASHGRCNYEGARQAIRELADGLSVEARSSGERWPRQAQLLQDCATALMQHGRRAEAEIALRAFSTVCLDLETADASREKLSLVGKAAIRAVVPLPVAEALSAWESRHGALSSDERLLLGNLYYVGGKNDKALVLYEAVEPQLKQGRSHRWLLIAMMTAHLRENRVGEAMSIFNRLRTVYPHALELEEGQYRLGEHYFDVREFDKAKQCFNELQKSSLSTDYQRLADEYLGRIEQVAKLEKNP
jgi:tetratricopeptide (TPR) repeat protein